MKRAALRSVLLLLPLTTAVFACASPEADGDASEAAVSTCAGADAGADSAEGGTARDDAGAGARLTTKRTAPDLLAALEAASADSGTILRAETFAFDRACTSDEAVAAALLGSLEHADLRQDEGAMDAAALEATLEEYGVADPDQRDAIGAALEHAVGRTATTRKLWLRSDDVPDADTEWAEVVGLYVAEDKGTALRLVIRVEM